MKAYTFRYLTLLCFIIAGFVHEAQAQELAVQNLRVEYAANPIGIDEGQPRLSWQLVGGERNTLQEAYQVQVSRNSRFTDGDLVWDTGKTHSDHSVNVRYEGPGLKAKTRYHWRVRVWDNHGNRSGWSNTAFWETGLLSPENWLARWIEPGFDQDTSTPQPSPMLRREFSLKGKVQSARAYVTGHGLYEMQINGRRVGDQVFTPGWTSYHNRLQYQAYDVTELLQEGENAIGVTLGDGWYRGYIGFNNQRNFYGDKLALLAQIEVTYAGGNTEVITTDKNWTSSTGPILKSDIYNGEVYDARLEARGWSRPGFDDGKWHKVRVVSRSMDNVIAQEGAPIRKIQKLKPVEILVTPEGDTVADMGQNMVGWVRLKVSGERGTKVTLQHAEVLDQQGNFYTDNLRAAEQANTYILSGKGEEIYEPRFTFQGFRYVKVQGYPGELSPDDLTGVVIHSDMAPTGHFESSDPLVNQLQHNIVWGQKGNFLDVPTDCPQRDERLGWTGDIQVFAQTACYNMDASRFLTKWLGDLEADQLDNGSIPHVVPNVLGEGWSGASGWADAGVVVPWTLYQAYGDKHILQRQYPSMKAWVEYMRRRAASDSTTYLWDSDFTFGDWLSFSSNASDYPGAYTDKNLISTAFFAHSADLLRQTAEILGKTGDVQRYAGLFDKIKEAFQNEYLTPGGRLMSNTQTSYLLALEFNLLPKEAESKAVAYLLGRIRERGHLTTGFLGTPYLNPVLSRYGYGEQAYKLLLRKDYPSWLYPVSRGATTIWERWDGIKPDGRFQDVGMNSFNHYAYGAIGQWLYTEVAGITATAPGYKRIAIRPVPGGGLTYARSFIHSAYGKVESAWEFNEGGFSLTVEIPANTRAEVTLPGAAGREVTEGGQPLAQADGIVQSGLEGSDRKLEIGSGRYTFTYQPGGQLVRPQIAEDSHQEPDLMKISDKVSELLANRHAREILNRHLPELMHSAWLSQVMGFTLEQAAGIVPEKNRFEEKLELISADLNVLSAK